MSDPDVKIKIKNLCFSYGYKSVFSEIQAAFQAHKITAIIGPSGQGKSTLLTVFNRLWEEIPAAKVSGEAKIKLDGSWVDVNNSQYPVHRLRRQVAMVFQDPNPLPMSVARNVAFPLRLAGEKDKALIEARVCRALQQAFLWDEVKDRLDADARILSGGQQQRLCIARALILDPEILLLDEPTASLDAKACGVIEDLLLALKDRCTILMVSHYMDQVRRVADCTAQLADGRLTANAGNSECKA